MCLPRLKKIPLHDSPTLIRRKDKPFVTFKSYKNLVSAHFSKKKKSISQFQKKKKYFKSENRLHAERDRWLIYCVQYSAAPLVINIKKYDFRKPNVQQCNGHALKFTRQMCFL